jgi:PAS domain S-box-containing protein
MCEWNGDMTQRRRGFADKKARRFRRSQTLHWTLLLAYVITGCVWFMLRDVRPRLASSSFSLAQHPGMRLDLLFFLTGILLLTLYSWLRQTQIRQQEQLQQRREVNHVQQRYNSLLANNSAAVCLLDLRGCFVDVNASLEKLSGYRSDELVRMPSFLDLVPTEDRELMSREFARVTSSLTLSRQTSQVTVMDKQGRRLRLGIKAVPVYEAGKVTEVFIVARDLTEAMRREEILKKSDKLSLVGELAAGVAHEIRNPLTALKGFVQLLGTDSNNQEKYLSIMKSELDRIEFIIKEFLMLAKPQLDNFTVKDIRLLLEDVTMLLQIQAILCKVQIQTDVGEQPVSVWCVEQNLKQVFINILKNAIESMPDGGIIQVRVDQTAHQMVRISVADEGVGIPEDRISKLGEPFYTTKEKGTGLGMMVSHRIVAAHKGRIEVKSRVNQGTQVSVLLPRYVESETGLLQEEPIKYDNE